MCLRAPDAHDVVVLIWQIIRFRTPEFRVHKNMRVVRVYTDGVMRLIGSVCPRPRRSSAAGTGFACDYGRARRQSLINLSGACLPRKKFGECAQRAHDHLALR